MARGRPRTKKYEPTVIGLNLKRLRERRGWLQGELATASGTDQPDISRTETGETQDPSGDLLKKWADALGANVDEFWATVQGPANDTLEEFLASPLARDVTQAEVEQLRRAVFP